MTVDQDPAFFLAITATIGIATIVIPIAAIAIITARLVRKRKPNNE